MMNLGYMNFYDIPEEVKTEKKVTPKGRKITPGQIKYYTDLCNQRNMTPEDVSNLSYDELSTIIKELTSFYPANQAQKDLINDKVKSIKEILVNVNFNDEQIAMFEQDTENLAHVIVAGLLRDNLNLEPIMSGLTGGRTGTASDLIGRLIKAEDYFDELQSITPAQLETIVGMYLCPDVLFEDYDIERTTSVDESYWRKLTPEEFAHEVSVTFNKKSASEFINRFKSVFSEWKATRIRPNQLKRIMNLESMLANDSKLRELQQAVTQEGEIYEVGTSANVQVVGTAYVQHTDEQLIHFTIQQASEFITQLEREVSRREEWTLEDNYEETSRGISSQKEALQKSFEVLSDMMYKLEAIAGYDDPDLHQAASFDVSSDPLSNEDKKGYIRDFIKDMIRNKAITYYGIMELAEESIALQQILLDM